jgi:parallel beta-helix repeat protein
MRSSLLIFIFLLWNGISALGANYYVRTDGNDSNMGTSNSASGAFRTITRACAIAQPGDVITIADGTYVEGEIGINNKNGSKTNVLTIRAINKHKVIIRSISGGSVISISNSKGVVIDGLEVTFQNPGSSYFFGILSDSSYWVTIRNCYVHDIGSSGIQVNNGEYFVVEGNVVRDNAKNTGNPNGSGISVYHPKYSPNYVTGDWGIIIRNNICFENVCPYPLQGYSTPVDGNGIILDDFRNQQGGGQSGGYTHPTLVENNLTFNNGGRGVHVYHSDNITIRNNTIYHNNFELSKYYGFGWNGDLNMDVSTGSKIYNNIIVRNNANARGYALLVPLDADVRNNLIIGGAAKMRNGTPTEGLLPADNKIQPVSNQQYVKFVNATTTVDPVSTTNPQFSRFFGLASGSPAIDAGTSSNSASTDLENKNRPIGAGIDMGCYESGNSVGGDTQAPTAPASLISTGKTQTSVSLSWTASSDNVGVVAYDIYQGSTLAGSNTTPSFLVTGLTANTTYSFTVKARDAAGNISAASNALSVTTLAATDTQAPSAPTNLTSSAVTATSFTLTWTAATDNVGVTSYEIFRNGLSIGTATATSFGVTGLAANTSYAMTAKAKDTAGNVSFASTSLSVTTLAATDTQAPSIPTNLSSSAISSTGFNLSWTASTDNAGVSSYEVFRNGSSIGTTTATSLGVTGLSASTTYSMTVKARDAAGNISAASNALSVTTTGISSGGSGLKGEFFTQFGYTVPDARTAIASASPLYTFTARTIDYPNNATTSTTNWNVWLGADGTNAPGESIQTSTLRLSGYIQIKPEFDKQSGNGTIDVDFAVASMGHMALRVNNVQVALNEANWAFGTQSTRVSFPAAGYYPIELLHSTAYDASGVELYSSIPGSLNPGRGTAAAPYIIPQSVLFQQLPGARIAAEHIPHADPAVSNLRIYPNPVAGQSVLLLESALFSNKKTMIYLRDITGKTLSVQPEFFSGDTLPLKFGPMPKGIYILSITDGQQTQQGRLVVQ